jgi:alkanesulfonate monooxygenase SsuD/methylene tetrahydromethanopterin reductase-like flavin-dependent oxidoreductase (luciferase family)
MDVMATRRTNHQGRHFQFKVDGAYQLLPDPVQQPHPPVFLAGATDRSIAVAGRRASKSTPKPSNSYLRSRNRGLARIGRH